jgi:hypothetical protein
VLPDIEGVIVNHSFIGSRKGPIMKTRIIKLAFACGLSASFSTAALPQTGAHLVGKSFTVGTPRGRSSRWPQALCGEDGFF